MQAMIYESFGAPEVVRLADVPKPKCLEDEVLVAIRATTVTAGDARLRAMDVPAGFELMSRLFFGFSKPTRPILGMEFAGEVVAIGARVTRFAVGDSVFGLSGADVGCHAEYKAISHEGALAKMPPETSFEEAATLCFGGTTALSFLRRAKLTQGERLLVVGASGAVGTAAVQLGKHLGAHVTGVCSAANIELVRSLGADETIDYEQTEFVKEDARYDVILDAVGITPAADCLRLLSPGGRLALIVASLPDMIAGAWTSATSDKRVLSGPAPETAADIEELARLKSEGALRAVIDRTYPLEEAAAAHAYVDTKRKRGNVVLVVGPAPSATER